MIYRIIGSVLVLITILFLPYWIYIPVLLVAIVIFPLFWEGLLLAFLIDIIHGSGIGGISFLISPFAISTLIILIVLPLIRKNLRLYV